jgi:DNA-binding transcriptional LysR family regulator
MDLRDIEYFAVVAEHGNVTRASEALGLTPTALSKSLRRLEKAVGAKIVKRTPKGVDLTAVGTALLASIRKIRLAVDDASREAADLGQGRAGHLRIGTGPTVCDELPRIFALLRKEAPNVTMDITVADNDVMIPSLRKGELDVIFNDFATHYEGTVREILFHDEFVVCASARHRLAARKRVTLADLEQEQWALSVRNLLPQQILVGALQQGGLAPPQVALQTRSLSVRLRTWATTDLLGYMSRRVIRESAATLPIRELPVKELEWRRDIGVLYRKDAYLSPAARRFIEILKASAKGIAAG